LEWNQLIFSALARIGEALGLEIDKHISSDFRTISIEQKESYCKVEERLKTASAFRKVTFIQRSRQYWRGSFAGAKPGSSSAPGTEFLLLSPSLLAGTFIRR
jgi:hypothetical protein